MATLQAIQDAVNARLSDFLPKVRARQSAYFANHGRFWQGIAFSTLPPDDGALVTPNFNLKPSDQNSSWADAGVNADLPAQVECQIAIHTYQKPGSVFGYFVVVRVSKNGTTYRRTGQVEMGAVVTNGSWAAE